MKQPSWGGHAPRGAHPRSPWTEPTFGNGLGSSVPSLADCLNVRDNAHQSSNSRITSLDAVSRRLSTFAFICASLHRTVSTCTVLCKVARPGVILRGTCP
uniref:Uncharacterized protein F1 n=1 Tax=Haloquadratum walsbyi TaxID=293091 RepID=A0A445MQI2_9EURY|nr:uncharacterized protein F1 [Haloquadratum walsbyi]